MPPFRIDGHDAVLSGRTGSEDWNRIASYRDRDGFIDGVFLYQTLIPAIYVDNIVMNKVIPEEWRFQMLVYTLHLFDTRDPSDPTSGLTLSNLQKLCAARGIASPGRVAAFLGLMQLGGLLTRTRSAADARVVRLEPSESFVATVERWNTAIFAVLDAVEPGREFVAWRAERPRLGWDMRRAAAEVLLGGWRPLDPFPEVAHFASRDGGWMLLTHCVTASLKASRDGAPAAVSVDLPLLGRRFGASRSQLRRLLESAFDAGLLTVAPRNGGHIVPCGRLVCAYLAWLASYLETFRTATLRALRAD